jgi:DNA-binding NtrC family response regulator
VTTILLVEDDSEHAEIVALRLGEEGYQVARAHTGPAAVSALQNGEPIAALVVDFKMPAMNGLDLLAEIRRRGFDQPFILLTAHGGEEVAVGALRGGASDYIVKDLDLDYLSLLRPTIERSIEKLHFLRESRKLAKALESTLAAVAITSPQGLVEYVNPAFEDITGFRRGNLLGKRSAPPSSAERPGRASSAASVATVSRSSWTSRCPPS